MKPNLPFDTHVPDYERWFYDYPFVFRSEVEALREMLPVGDSLSGIEVALGTGRFAEALGIKEGVEPSPDMRARAVKRGIEVVDGVAEQLPYGDLRFDFVLMAFCISYFNDLHVAFKEANRVLKNKGVLVLGFLDKHSIIGRQYEQRLQASTFYRSATFYTADKVHFELTHAGFKRFRFCQTLFHRLEEITSLEPARPGYGEGSFVVIQAGKT
ncbi:class I SAM-dependent methyltransferase [Dawidia soli]|uniref:Methyltransferase domain-containing protein n=1 Tax=Dawidia soli TaxID=2782352 RepID=A0AAP2D7B7_9BACT|nr:class I SAM-dependent methyltransferase [Dawidia soli]MBT1686462.1 methyltransferase domain-containing protein [Dawidia soli]